MVKHDDPAMTWYDHGDPYSPWYDHGDSYSSWYDHGKIMSWSSWNIAWSCHGDHGHYYNVVRTLIFQPTLLISNEVVVRYILMRDMLNELIRNYSKDVY